MKIIVATSNMNKIKEFDRILSKQGIEVVSPKDLNISIDPEETGKTFMENAYIKAKAFADETGFMAVADDSGLCIEALCGQPGVYSARYGGKDTPYQIKNDMMLEKLKDVEDDKRTAYFESAVCLVLPNSDKTLKVSGKCYGKIGYEQRGTNGFGYDPIFYVGDKSYAQLSGEEKDKISHRGKALEQFSQKITDFLNK